MASRFRKPALLILLVPVLALVAVGIGLVPLNLFFIEGYLRQAVAEATGLDLVLEEGLSARLGLRPSVSVPRLALRGGPRTLVLAEGVTIGPGLIELLGGEFHLRDARADSIRIDYCASWPESPGAAEAPGSSDPAPSVAVDRLVIDSLWLECSVDAERIDLLPQHWTLTAGAGLNEPMRLTVEAHGADQIRQVEIEAASLGHLLEDPEEYSVRLQAHALEAAWEIEGSISHPLSSPRAAGDLRLNAESAAVFFAIFLDGFEPAGGIELSTGFAVSSETIEVTSLEGRLDGEVFSGSAHWERSGHRPGIRLDLDVPRLDPDRIGSWLSAGAGPEPSTAFGDALEFTRSFDATGSLRVGRLVNEDYELREILIHAGLNNGILQVTHAGLEFIGQPLRASATLTPGDCLQLQTGWVTEGLDLAMLDTVFDEPPGLTGQVEKLGLETSSCGNTIEQHRDTLSASLLGTGIRPFAGPDIELVQAEVSAAWSESGRAAVESRLSGEPVSLVAELAPLQQMIGDGAWPVSLQLEAPDARLSLNGQARHAAWGLELDARFVTDVSRMGALAAWLPIEPGAELDLAADAGIRATEQAFELNDIEIRLGRSDLSGRLSLPAGETERPAILRAESGYLDIDELVALISSDDPDQGDDVVTLPPDIDPIDRWLGFPWLDLDLSTDSVSYKGQVFNNVQLDAVLDDRLIDSGHLALVYRNIPIEGLLDANFRGDLWTTAYSIEAGQIDIGEILSDLGVAENVDATAGQVEFDYRTEGRSLAELDENSEFEAVIQSLSWSARIGDQTEPFDFRLSELELWTAPSHSVSWSTSGELNETPVQLWMETPRVLSLLERDREVPLRVAISLSEEIILAEGKFRRGSDEALQAEFVVSGEDLAEAPADLSDLQSPLSEFSIATRLESKKPGALQVDIEFASGITTIDAVTTARREEGHWFIDTRLFSPLLETEDLVLWADDFRHMRKTLRSVEPAAESNEASLVEVVNEVVDSITEGNTFDVTLDIDDLRSADHVLGEAHARLHAERDSIVLDPAKIALPGGDLDLEYRTVLRNGNVDYLLDVDVERLQYEGLARLLDAETDARGELYLDLELQGSAPDGSALAPYLNGYFDLVVFPEEIDASFLDLWAANLIFALLPGFSGSEKKMNCMVARFDVEDGIMQTNNSFLDTTDIIVRGRGDIDLVKRELDLMIAPQAKLERFLSVSAPLVVSGPFDDFEVEMAPGGFITTMFRWYYGLIYVPWKWLTGERYPADGVATCFNAMDWDLPAETDKVSR